MAIVKMKKLRVMAMADSRDQLLRELLRLGCVEISEPAGHLADPAWAALLRRVERHRSLRAAAMDMGMAYSKAWSILREAEQGLGFKLLHTTTGGKNGGGAALTAEGARMLEAYERFEAELKAEAETLFLAHFHDFAGD